MIRFIYVIFINLIRCLYMIPWMRWEANRPEKYSEQKRYDLVRRAVGMVQRSGFIRTNSYGTENLPKEGGYVMFPNHQGKYDVIGIFASHDDPCAFVMDKDKSFTILIREIVDLVQGKRMDKNDIRQSMKIINEISEEVKNSRKYVIFPEGGYESNNQNSLGTFKAGSFKCAIKAKVPIVPVALIDSYKVFNSNIMGRITTQVHFLKPLYYEEYKEMKTAEIAALVKERISDVISRYDAVSSC